MPLVSVHRALRPVPLPPALEGKLALLKKGRERRRFEVEGGGRGRVGREMAEEDALYAEAQGLISKFRREFSGALMAGTQEL